MRGNARRREGAWVALAALLAAAAAPAVRHEPAVTGAAISLLQAGPSRWGHVAALLPDPGGGRPSGHLWALPLEEETGGFRTSTSGTGLDTLGAAWDAATAVELSAGYGQRLSPGALGRTVSRGDLAPGRSPASFWPGRAGFASRPGAPAGRMDPSPPPAPSGAAFGPPVVVAWPNSAGPFLANLRGYGAFAARHRGRRRVVFSLGADGVLHALDGGPSDEPAAGSGAELFAYRPGGAGGPAAPGLPALLPAPSFEDLPVEAPWAPAGPPCPPGEGGGEACRWRTVLAGGLGPLGRSVFALDVTRADSGRPGSAAPDCLASDGRGAPEGCEGPYPALLWEFADGADADRDGKPDLSFTFSAPALGRAVVGEGGEAPRARAVALFGGGLDPADLARGVGRGAGRLYVLDASRGRVLSKLDRGEVRDAAGHVAARRLAPVAAPVAVADLDLDGLLDVAYFGDLAGQLWRLSLSPRAPGFAPGKETVPALVFDGAVDAATARPCGGPSAAAPPCGPGRAVLFAPAILRAGSDPATGRPRYAVAWATGLPASAPLGRGDDAGRVVVVFDGGGPTKGPGSLERIPSPTSPLRGGCGKGTSPPANGWVLDLLPGERAASGVVALAGELHLLAGRGPDAPGRSVRHYRLLLANGDPCRGDECCLLPAGTDGRSPDRGAASGAPPDLWAALVPSSDAGDRPRVVLAGTAAGGSAPGLAAWQRAVPAPPRIRSWRER